MRLSKTEDDEKSVIQGEGVEKFEQAMSEPVNEKAFGSLQTQHFEDAVCQLAQLCLVHVNEKNSEKHLVFLSLLLQSFHTPRIFSVSQILILLSLFLRIVVTFYMISGLQSLIHQKLNYSQITSTAILCIVLINCISQLLAQTKTTPLFVHLLQTLLEFDENIPGDNKWMEEKNPAVQFLLKRVVKWLAEMGRSDTEHLVEMLFSSLSCCSQEEITQILNHVTTVTVSSFV